MRVFIGSSNESSEALGWVEKCIEGAGDQPLRWDKKSLFPLGEYTFSRLMEISKTVDAAIFIFSEDDHVWYRMESTSQPRDNVLIEYGLFAGQLGTRRAIICVDGKPKTSTDLAGIINLDISKDNRRKAGKDIKKWLQSLDDAIDEDENKNEFTWPDVEKGVDKIIAEMEKDGYEPDLVIGIGRSGGIVGGLIAGYLKAKPFRVFNWNYKNINKDGKKERIHILDKTIEIEKEQQKILLVKGATTAGQTPEKALVFFKEKFPDKVFRYAVLVRQKSSTASIDYCAYEVLGIKILPWHVDSWPTFLTHDIK
jgi:hypoxanthine phosphoribosyltransferase